MLGEKMVKLSMRWLAVAGFMLLGASALLSYTPAAIASGGSQSGGTPGSCLTINVPSSVFTYNVGGDVTLKADLTNCSSDTSAPQLIVVFRAVYGGGYSCVYPESAGNPANFTILPGSSKSISCTANGALNAVNNGLPAEAQVYANCMSLSTQKGGAEVTNLDGSRFILDLQPTQGITNSSCTLMATSNLYTVVSGINPNGIPRK